MFVAKNQVDKNSSPVEDVTVANLDFDRIGNRAVSQGGAEAIYSTCGRPVPVGAHHPANQVWPCRRCGLCWLFDQQRRQNGNTLDSVCHEHIARRLDSRRPLRTEPVCHLSALQRTF